MNNKTPQQLFLIWRTGIRHGFSGQSMDKVLMDNDVYKESYKKGYDLYKKEVGESINKFGYIPNPLRMLE
jgi:hypothetical protein